MPGECAQPRPADRCPNRAAARWRPLLHMTVLLSQPSLVARRFCEYQPGFVLDWNQEGLCLAEVKAGTP
jgi:hypothetical protein